MLFVTKNEDTFSHAICMLFFLHLCCHTIEWNSCDGKAEFEYADLLLKKNLLMLSVLKLHVLKQLNVFSVTSNQMNVPFFNTNN